MVVLGDVFAVIAFLTGVCLSAWALTLGMALVFGKRASLAQRAVEVSPWKSFFIGLVLIAVAGFVSLVMLGLPNPGLKLAGFIGSMALLGLAFLGMSGMASLVGKRIQPMEPDLSSFRALGRGAGLLVVASLLPFLGWFVFAPLMLTFATGAGFLALLTRSTNRPAFEMGAA